MGKTFTQDGVKPLIRLNINGKVLHAYYDGEAGELFDQTEGHKEPMEE